MGQKYGQHFLTDSLILNNLNEIILRIQKEGGYKKALEIGPGKGALTRSLLGFFETLTLFEVDRSMENSLQNLLSTHSDCSIVRGDVLQQDTSLSAYSGSLVLGNLPYYITSPILRKFFNDSICFDDGVFLVQHELAEKVSTTATKKSYLRRLLNYSHTVTYEFLVPADSFSPPPRVKSAVVSIKKVKKGHSLDRNEYVFFIESCQPYKRKTLGKILKLLEKGGNPLGYSVPEDLLGRRLEELELSDVEVILGEAG